MRPRIAINCDYDPGAPGAKSRRQVTLYMPYVEAIIEASGLPLLVPPSPLPILREYLSMADGILFTGGLDYPPEFYGQKPTPEVQEQARERAESDRALMKLALASPKPALGICAGLQLMNIAKGGALIQHLPAAAAHKAKTPERDSAHEVRVAPGSLLHSLFQSSTLRVNSAHHQAADPKRLARGLKVTAQAPDGTIEALELEKAGPRFFLFVQWHPERIKDAEHRRKLFAAFVAACRR